MKIMKIEKVREKGSSHVNDQDQNDSNGANMFSGS